VSTPVDRFYQNLHLATGIEPARPEQAEGEAPSFPWVHLKGVTVGELAHALRFSGLTISNTLLGLEIRRVDSSNQKEMKR
jgi:hypothetical protein